MSLAGSRKQWATPELTKIRCTQRPVLTFVPEYRVSTMPEFKRVYLKIGRVHISTQRVALLGHRTRAPSVNASLLCIRGKLYKKH